MTLGPAWRVRRTGGLLAPGFTKRFDPDGSGGMTYLWGIPIGRFRLIDRDHGPIELRYVRWPVVDLVGGYPPQARGPIDGAGFVRVPGGRVLRFCRFRLECRRTD